VLRIGKKKKVTLSKLAAQNIFIGWTCLRKAA
jgi:hypothetical protein